MPLSTPNVSRARLHTRRVSYEGFRRDDGLIDIDAHMTDTKDDDFALRSGVRPAGGVHGCTHLTELLGYLPTAAVQTFATISRPEDARADKKPFQLDRCHALETTTDTVRTYFPNWYRGAATSERMSEQG